MRLPVRQSRAFTNSGDLQHAKDTVGFGPPCDLYSQKGVATPIFKKAAKAGRSRYQFGASRIDCEVRSRECPLSDNNGQRVDFGP
jgi:hypothetical protein